MAHSWHRAPPALAVVCAIGLAAAPQAWALVLGEAEVRSALGEGLDLRIPVTIGKGESIEPSCFTLARDPAATVPMVTNARISLERSLTGTYLRIRTDAYISEPALEVALVAACPGQFAQVQRKYSLLVDPRSRATPPPAVASAAAAPSPSEASPAPPPAASGGVASIATLIARIGDTLESIANAIFPRNRAAKKSYITALRETNPPLATLGDTDPIPVDTPIALPDLRTFAKGRPLGDTQAASAPRRAPREAPVAAAPRESRARTRVESRTKIESPARAQPRAAPEPRVRLEERAPIPAETALAKTAPPARGHSAPGFVLKLSSPEVDLARSRVIDERGRAQLRDRQLVLDVDDQVAAVLALRNSVRQLESRVAELQLKLAGMPSSFPPQKAAEPKAAPSVAVAPPPAAAGPVVTPPAAAVPSAPSVQAPPASEPAAKPETPAVAAASPAAPTVEAPAVGAPAVAEKSEGAVPAVTPPAISPSKKPVPAAPGIDWMNYGLWAVAFVLIAAAILLALRLARRRREEAEYDFESPPEDDQIVVADEPLREEPVFGHEPEAEVESRFVDSDAELATHLPGDTDDLRRRYIEERFPEIGKGAITLDDPNSVVKGARLFYEDRALQRAVELLQFAIERRPEEVKTWLALFEIFRLERLAGEFGDLARRFREHHGKGDYWRKVQYFGREIDAGNELYAESPLNTFETIGPSQAKRLAAESSFDPVSENWLGAPMDFQNEVLANELRKTLMAQAGINEQDLVPNPMPALRNVEMFTVA